MLTIRCEIFEKLDDAVAAGAHALDRVGQPCPFDRIGWFTAVAAARVAPGRPFIVMASAGDHSAWLFLRRDGRAATALSCWYSFRVGPVWNGAVAPALLTAAARALRGRIGRLCLSPMAGEIAAMTAAAFAEAGWIVTRDATHVSWSANVQGASFADYWAGRPGQLRSTVKRKRARANMRVTIHRAFDADDWAEYERIYAESWKGDEGAPALLRRFAEKEGAAGTLRLGIGRVDGRAVAAQFWSVDHGRAWIHKLAYCERAHALSPGSILTASMMEYVIDTDRVDVIDYGTGDDAYKRDWMTDRAALYTVEAHDPRSIAGLPGAARTWVRRLVDARRAG